MQQQDTAIRVERSGAVATILLNRPAQANTITLQLTIDFNDALDALESDPSVHCILVTGAGGSHFCGGADLRDIGNLISSDGVIGDQRRDFIRHIEEISKPVIAVINGAAMGGGCEIALACDFRIMADNATIGLPEINFGALPAAGGTQRLPRLVGTAKAKELIFTGRPLSAQQALNAGLVNQVCPPGDLLTVAGELAALLSDKAPYALAAAKRLINLALEVPLDEGLAIERKLIRDMATPAEMEEFRRRSMAKSKVYEGIFAQDKKTTKGGAGA